MDTNSQEARLSLGIRLRELRTSARLTGHQLAARLGWTQSKVSKLENGRQAATPMDLRAWADGTGRPEAAEELLPLLHQQAPAHSWHRHRTTALPPSPGEALNAEYERSATVHLWDGALVVGVLQTAEYTRHLCTRHAELHLPGPENADDAVRTRLKRQETLYAPDKTFRIVLWEPALYTRICPPAVLAAQLDRLSGVIGLDTVSLGIVPLDAPLRVPPAPGFSIHDDRLVVTESWDTERWLNTVEHLARYREVWEALSSSAVHGPQAQSLITRARRALD